MIVIWHGALRDACGTKGGLLPGYPSKPVWEAVWSAWMVARGELMAYEPPRTGEKRERHRAYNAARRARLKAERGQA